MARSERSKAQRREYAKQYYKQNRYKIIEAAKERQRIKGRSKKVFPSQSPEAQKVYKIRYAYGLSGEQYTAMLEEQGHKCAICETSFESLSKRNIHIDHCHSTGNVRGVLCGSCNTGLGRFRDNVSYLQKAIGYLNGT